MILVYISQSIAEVSLQLSLAMGQAETKLFHQVPTWYITFAADHTDLLEDTVQICWNFWRTDSRSGDGKLDFQEFTNLICSLSCETEGAMVEQLFRLLDRDEDDYVEFSDILVFLYSIKPELDGEEKRLRSFRFYDRKYLEIFIGTVYFELI